MHGRLKVRSTEEQKLLKEKEQLKKLTAYRLGMKKILSSRKTNLKDPESLSICSQLLVVNPDIYTLWNYRKEVALMQIEESKMEETYEETLIQFLEDELKLTEHCLIANPKSYGSWHHRYWILEHHPKPNWEKEFDLCTKYLSMDDRNFHCWDYRRLILNKVGVSLNDELKFSTDRININFSNYSSWHYRSTLKALTEDTIDDELTLVQNALFTDPADSSAWFYLRWVLSNSVASNEHKKKLLLSLNELFALEPHCKWVIMAKCWLVKDLASNIANCEDDRMECYKKLEELDWMRKGQYQDHQEFTLANS